jgi:hypothetical protein
MSETDENAIQELSRAIAAFAGPVTRCPPGKARAPTKPTVVINKSVEWLKENRGVHPVRNVKAERRRARMGRAWQKLIVKRNTPLLKRVISDD